MFFTSCIYSGVGVSFWWAGPILYVYCYTYIYSPEYASMYVHPAYHGLIYYLPIVYQVGVSFWWAGPVLYVYSYIYILRSMHLCMYILRTTD